MTNEVKIENYENSSYAIGRKQWDLLDAIAEKYRHVNTAKLLHDGKFFDSVWHPIDPAFGVINFEMLFPNKSLYPLELLSRVMCYELILNQGYAASTIFIRLKGFSHFVKSSTWGDVMIAERNQPFSLLSSLEPEVLTNFAQSSLSKTGNVASTGFKFLNLLIQMDTLSDVKVFTTGITLPWREEDIGLEKWLEQQRTVTGIIKEETGFLPLPFENVSNVVQHALPIVVEHHETLNCFFEEFRKIANGYNSENWLKVLKSSKQCADLAEKYKSTFDLILPLRYANFKKGRNYTPIQAKWLTDLFALVQSACVWIILLTTGLRNIDMRDLRIGCCKPSKRSKGLWWLVADVKKTKNRLVIPVGKPTYMAVKLLEVTRFHDDCVFLIEATARHDKSHQSGREYTDEEIGRIKSPQVFNRLLKELPITYDFSIATTDDNDEDATAHCVRATLAGYIAQNSNVAILILKRLFGHTNALMPNEYIYRNPLIIKKREALQLKLANEMASDMAHAVTYGKVSGRNGERLLKGAEAIKEEIEKKAKLKNLSLTEMDLFQSLEERLRQIFFDDIINGETYALLTPMAVICNRSCNNSSDSPCAAQSNHSSRIAAGIKKVITNALISLPNPAQCVGVSCSDALLGEKWSRPLLESFDFYLRYRQASSSIESIDEEATAFIKIYAEPLKQIYADERGEGYFNV